MIGKLYHWQLLFRAHQEVIITLGYKVEPVVEHMKESLARERAAEDAVGWNALIFPTPAFRRMLLVGVGTAVSQQLVGIDAIQNYLLDVLDQSGIASGKKQNTALIILGVVKLLFIFVGGKLFDKRGRRPLLFASLIGMAISLLMISIAFLSTASSTSAEFTIFGLGLYLASFSVGMGPGAWLIPSEIFPLAFRAKAMSVATVLNRATATFMSSTFLSIANAMSWGGFFLGLCFVCIFVLLFLWMFLPETKGRSLEEMTVYFAEITNDRSVLDAESVLRRGPAVELTSKTSPMSGSPIV